MSSRCMANYRRVTVELIRDVEGLGYRGEIKAVKPGYARNFLFPRQMAIYKTSSGTSGHATTVHSDTQASVEVSRARDMLVKRTSSPLVFNKFLKPDSDELRVPIT